jgi:hypothetical protein
VGVSSTLCFGRPKADTIFRETTLLPHSYRRAVESGVES